MNNYAKGLAVITMVAGCSSILLSASQVFAVGSAADAMCNPYYQQCPCDQIPDKTNPQKCMPGGAHSNTHACSTGVCQDTTNGKITLGICSAQNKCDATKTNGQTPQQATPQQMSQPPSSPSQSAGSGGGGSGGGGGLPSVPSGGSGGGSGSPSTAQVTESNPISQPEVLNPSQTAQAVGSTPPSSADTAAGSTPQSSQSAQTTLDNLIGQMTPDQSVSQMFMQPGDSAVPTQATDISQPSWLSGAEASLQPSGAPPDGLSGGEGTSPAVPTSEPPLSTYEPSSLPFSETNPMGSLDSLNSADIQAANSDALQTPSEQAAQSAAEAAQNAAANAQNTQDLNTLENGASTFGQSAADYLNNGSETNGQFPTNSPDGNAYLADQRASLMSPLDPSSPNYDPNLRTEVEAVINNEVNPTNGQQAADAVLESMANRSLMNGYMSLSQAINSGFYGPVNTGAVSNMVANGMSGAQTAFADQAISDVAGGSNVCNYCTDQGMVNEIQGPKTNIGGEYFGYMNGNSSWSDAEAAQAQVYNASYASQQASALPSQAQTVPYSWAGDISSVASLGSSAPINDSALATAADNSTAWSGQTGSTVDWTNVAAIYGSPSPTLGEDIASAAEPSGEPTTDQLGNETEAGIWGDQQQNIVDEQLALEDREAQAVAETAAYNGALAAQNGLTETGEAIANAITPSGPGEDQSPALTSSIVPSQAQIDQPLANAYAGQSLPEVDAVNGDFQGNSTPPPIESGPQVPETAQGQPFSEQSNPTISTLEPQQPETAQGQSSSEQPAQVSTDLSQQPAQEGQAIAQEPSVAVTSEAESPETAQGQPITEQSNPTISGLEASPSETAQSEPFSLTPQQVVSDLTGQTAPFSSGGGIGSDFASSNSILSSGSGGIGSDFASNNSALSSGSGGIGSDFASNNSTLSSGQGGIGSDFASSQGAPPVSAETPPIAPVSPAEQPALQFDQGPYEFSQGLTGGTEPTSENSFGQLTSNAATLESPAQLPSWMSDIMTPFESAGSIAANDYQAFMDEFASQATPLSSGAGGIGSDFASNNSILSSGSGGIGSDFVSSNSTLSSGAGGIGSDFASNNSQLSSGAGGIGSDVVSNNSTLSSGQGGIGSDFASNNSQLSSGSGGIGSDEASSKSSSPSTPETPQSPQSPQTPASPEQNPAIENPPLPTARPTTPSNPSIVDFLNSAGVDASYATRAALAAMNGIDNYVGSAAQNLKLLQVCFAGNCFK